MKKDKHIKSIRNILKKNIKLLIGLLVGTLITTGTVYAAIKIASSNVYYDKTTSGLTSSNVQDAIDELKTKANNCSSSSGLQVGDYLTLVPDKSTYTIATSVTGYDSAQTITPNELTLWRVININDNGTYDAVSEYVSSTDVYFKGTTGYANLVGGLQTIAAQYAKSGITTGTRMMGYDGQTLTITNTAAFDGTSTTAPSETSTPSPTTGTGQNYTKNQAGDLGDTLYLKDFQLVQNTYKKDNNITNYCSNGICASKVGTSTLSEYWLASRRYYYGASTNFGFHGRSVDAGGTVVTNILRYYTSGWSDNSISNSLRPIITLTSGVTISGGYGIKSEPYTIQ